MSEMTDRLTLARSFAWARLLPAYDWAIFAAREAEYLAGQASNLVQAGIDPVYPPVVHLLADAIEGNDHAED